MKKVSLFTLVALFLTPIVAAASHPSFIQDDYSAALAQARQRNLPIFVDCWAPW